MKGSVLENLKKRPASAALILINIVIFFFVELSGSSQNTAHMLQMGASYEPLIMEDGQWYRLFTSMFLHFGMAHLLNNMLVLFVLGTRLEPVLGKVRLVVIYLAGGLGGNVISLALSLRSGDYHVSAGASGAVFALMGSILYVLLRSHGRVQDLNTRQVLIMAALSLYLGFASTGVDNAAHVGGLVCGFILTVLLYHPAPVSSMGPGRWEM